MWEKQTLSTCAENSIVPKNWTKNLGPILDDTEQYMGTIHASNPEHLLVLRVHAGMIQNRTRGIHQWKAGKLIMWSQGQWEASKQIALGGDNIQHTDGYRDYYTDPAHRTSKWKSDANKSK